MLRASIELVESLAPGGERSEPQGKLTELLLEAERQTRDLLIARIEPADTR